MKFFSSRSRTFQGSKELPNGTIVVVTQNNQQALRDLLRHLTTHPFFQVEGGRILVVDQYSYDRTLDVAKEFADSYPDKISFLQKRPEKQVLELVRPMLSDQIVEVINLHQIEKANTHIPPKKMPDWRVRLRQVFGKPTTDGIDTKKLLDRIELDRRMMYTVLRGSVLEPLTHLEMQLKYACQEQGVTDDSVFAVQRMIRKINTALKHFDPAQFVGESLLPCMTSLVGDFTNRTQVTCTLKETGQEIKIEPYFGISVVRMLQEAFDNIEKHAGATRVDVRIRWGSGKVMLQVKDDGRGMELEQVSRTGLSFIEERAMILGGAFRVTSKPGQGTTLFVALPVPRWKGE